MLNAKIVHKSYRDIQFEATSSKEITEDMALEAQAKLGYMPQGYGFYNFKVTSDPVLFRYRATWDCLASCD